VLKLYKLFIGLGPHIIDINRLLSGEQIYRELDSKRVAALAEEFLDKHCNFYQPVCVMVRGMDKQRFLQENQEDNVGL